MPDERTPARYRFGPRSTRGLIAGWRGGQIACVAVASVVGLGLVRSVGGAVGALAGIACAAGGVAVAAVPVAGRPVESWAPTVARFAAAQMADGSSRPWSLGPARRGALSHLVIRELDGEAGRPLAVLEDSEAGTWTASVPVGGAGFALLDEPGRSDAVARWSGVLAAMAAEHRSLHRLQWLARSYPAVLDPPVAESAGGGAHRPASDDYDAFVRAAASRIWNREVLVAVTVRSPPRNLQRNAGSASVSTSMSDLLRLIDGLGDRLRGIGLAPGRPLDGDALSMALRRAFASPAEPASRPGPLPLGTAEQWSRMRTDATWQATFWVAEWPRGEVGPGVLLPLLLASGEQSAVSVTMAPLPPLDAVRRAEHERTSGAADAELRVRHGFALTARARLEQETRQHREDELADGHAAYLFAGYVAVTAGDEASLERACSAVEQAAALAQLVLHRVYGAQQDAWCCTLPTGRGCG